MSKTTIIYLHGATGSGKTSVAEALHERIDGFFLRFSLDTIWSGFPRNVIDTILAGEAVSDVKCPGVGRAYVECVCALASLGFNLIIDDDLPDRIVREHVLTRMEEHGVILVGLYCPLEELQRREPQRPDRAHGSVERDWAEIQQGLEYDLVVDTSRQTPEGAANAILDFLRNRRTNSTG